MFKLLTYAVLAYLAYRVFFEKPKQIERKTKSENDLLTGLYNHATVFNKISETIQDHDLFDSIWLMILDIDDFKIVNDKYGHLVGDQVLGSISKILKSYVNDDCIAGRYGGDEFIILFTNTREEDILWKTKKIKESMQALEEEY